MQTNFLPRFFLIAAVTLVLGSIPARATVITFAQFTDLGVGQNPAAVAASLPADLTLLGRGVPNRHAGGDRVLAAAPVAIIVPKADALPALSFLVGVAGLWELLRRFRGGWTRAGRVEPRIS